MALIIQPPTKSSISSDCVTMVITDSTGNYSATNLTGYGAPNTARSSLYLKLLVILKKSTGDEYPSIAAVNENTVASWTVTVTNDGVYELYLFACSAWSSTPIYGIGSVVYTVAQDKFYYSIQANNNNHAVTDAAWWLEATLKSHFTPAFTVVETEAIGVYYSASTNILEKCRVTQCLADAMVEEQCGCECDPCAFSKYEKVKRKIEAADIFFTNIVDTASAQKMIEDLEKICTCTCDC